MTQPNHLPHHMVHVAQPNHWRQDSVGYGEPHWTHTGPMGPHHDDIVRRNTAAIDARMSKWTFPVEQTTRLPLDRG